MGSPHRGHHARPLSRFANLCPITGSAARAAQGGGDTSPEAEDPVLRALPPGESASLDELARATLLGASDLLGRLVRLEAEGVVERAAGGSWLRSGR